MDQHTVKSLINQSLNGDKTSFRKLLEFYQPFAYATAFRLVCNEYESEEIVQEAFIRVWKNLDRFDCNMRFTTWLYKIVVNLSYDKIRTARILQNKTDFDLSNYAILNKSSAENIESGLINRELAEIIRILTGKLTPRQKLVFTLSELEGLSVDEIKTITGLTSQKIKSNLYCARQNIREKLDRIENRRENHET